ncbi:MAG: phosphatidylserine decarboxylase family protein [Planctomycetes bacterium]|nr:phosphatidylserine decarboxylase family protein [Planctomycetota bacterium]
MRLPLAKYSAGEIAVMLVITGVMGYVLYQMMPVLVILPALLFLFTLYFFRDPYRKIPEGDNLIVSPADGTIIEIADVNEDTFIKEPSVKVAIFLSVFNVHINRAPCDGKITLLDYRKGRFLVASEPEASSQNERNSIGITAGHSLKILVRQIAGIIAQRIVCGLEMNQQVKRGDRIGMIKFGSRTEVYISKNKLERLEVKVNDKVKGGESIIGVYKK